MRAETGASSASSGPTRQRLLRAAERLFAERGIGPTPTRAILREAEQRNESALQYHFGGRDGLIEALYQERGEQIGKEREQMLRGLGNTTRVDTRALCEVALMPAVRIARREPELVLFLKVVGQLAFLPSEKLQESVARYEGDSVANLARRIRPRLDLPAALIARRVELIQRLAALSLAQRALTGEPFEGADADLFFESLLDAMTGILEGSVSNQTRRCLKARPSKVNARRNGAVAPKKKASKQAQPATKRNQR